MPILYRNQRNLGQKVAHNLDYTQVLYAAFAGAPLRAEETIFLLKSKRKRPQLLG